MVRAVTPIPFVKARFFDRCGKPLAGGKVYTYEANTTTPKVTYKDPYGLTPNTNPIILDAAGEADIYLDGTYRIRITDRNDVLVNDVAKIGSWFSDNLQDTLDNISGAMDDALKPILQNLDNAINIAAAAGAGANGWTDTLIAVSENVNQRQINDGLESISQLLAIKNPRNGQRVYVKSYHAGYNRGGGWFVFDATINDWVRVDVKTVTPEMFGYNTGDATTAFTAAALYAKANNLSFEAKDKNGYLITNNVDFYTDTSISKIKMIADGTYRYISVKSTKTPTTIPISSLGGLTEFSKKITGFPTNSVGKYFKIESQDILTERNNVVPENYFKNTAFRLVDTAGSISPSLDMTFDTNSTTATVKIYDDEVRIKVSIGTLEVTGTGLNHNGILIERDAVDFAITDVKAESGFRTLCSITGNACNLYNPVIKDSQYAGYGYGISIGLCCDTNIYSMKGSNCRTTLDGRHSANVTVYNSKLETAGSHWGNNFLFKDCDIDVVTWSGKDLFLVGGTLRGYVSMRVDVAMCIGTLSLTNLAATNIFALITPSSNIIGNFFTTSRRLFDTVIVDNIICNDNIPAIYSFGNAAADADWIPPSNFYFNDIYAPKSNQLIVCYIKLDNATALAAEGRVRINNITAKVVVPFMARGFVKYTSGYGYDIKAVDCGKVFIKCDANVFSKYKLTDSTLIGANRINNSTARGDIILNDCIIEHDATIATNGLFYIEARKGFVNVEYKGVFSNVGSVNGATMYSIAAKAQPGAINYPTPLANYINRTIYQLDGFTFAFDPPSISANGYLRQEFDVSGVQIGDAVRATFSIFNANIKVSGDVSATNKVSVLFQNLSATPVDLGSGTVTISKFW